MKFYKDTAFVVRRTNYRDADRILTLYSREKGKIEVLAKGVRKLTSKRASHAELLNQIKFEAVTGRRGLVLAQTTLLNSFSSKRQTFQYITSMFYICELVTRLCPPEEKNENVFELLEEFLTSQNGSRSISTFQKTLLTHLGYWNERKTTTSVTQINSYIESILERRLNTHKYL